MAWKKGETGNSRGRPKTGAAMTDLLRKELNRRGEDKIPLKTKLVKKLIDKAIEGDPACLKYVIDRLDGRPNETITASVHGNIIDIEAVQKKLEDALLNDYGTA